MSIFSTSGTPCPLSHHNSAPCTAQITGHEFYYKFFEALTVEDCMSYAISITAARIVRIHRLLCIYCIKLMFQADILERMHSNTPGAPTFRENPCFAPSTEK